MPEKRAPALVDDQEWLRELDELETKARELEEELTSWRPEHRRSGQFASVSGRARTLGKERKGPGSSLPPPAGPEYLGKERKGPGSSPPPPAGPEYPLSPQDDEQWLADLKQKAPGSSPPPPAGPEYPLSPEDDEQWLADLEQKALDRSPPPPAWPGKFRTKLFDRLDDSDGNLVHLGSETRKSCDDTPLPKPEYERFIAGGTVSIAAGTLAIVFGAVSGPVHIIFWVFTIVAVVALLMACWPRIRRALLWLWSDD
jgi:hypothetical protein